MTLNLRRAIVLSLLCLTAFTTTASAECAWVLLNGGLNPSVLRSRSAFAGTKWNAQQFPPTRWQPPDSWNWDASNVSRMGCRRGDDL